ncbi:MAG: 4-hydroxyphenylpyruvate dioxygenase [Actinomycetota bacterium]|nr:4-hydroxyphenylpyruvate dioxygenase [Actinomycetota bacterium]
MPLTGIDHVELYVGNAAQSAFFYTRALGFREIAYAGLETGLRDRVSHVLQQGRIRLVLTGALSSDSDIAAHHRRHGDGVKAIALGVPDVDAAWRAANARGARGLAAPHTAADEDGAVRLATIAAYGDTVHTFVQRDGYGGPFLPGYVASQDNSHDGASGDAGRDAGARGDMLLAIDHIVGNVELGAMDEWVAFYERVFGMTEMLHFSDEAISTDYSALMSKVVTDGSGRVKFPINEPAPGRRRSQIDEYLQFHEGPGAQHIAVATRDIVGTVAELRRRGVGFLPIPDAYYEDVPARVGEIAEPVEDLRREGILVDRDDEGYMLQIFTRPLGDRPTVFLEIIERHGARGFGEGNFRALFEAIEREQERRGNL